MGKNGIVWKNTVNTVKPIKKKKKCDENFAIPPCPNIN